MARPHFGLLLKQLRRAEAQRAAADLSDPQLIERFAATRDEDAFAALLQRHGPMVLGVCRRILRDEHASEDAFQAAFFVLARKAASIPKGASVASWLHGVALRVAHKARVETIRRERRERRQAAPALVEDGDALTWKELRSILDEELNRLAARWREPLILCYLEGRTQDEASQRLGWSKSTLRRRLERGRQILQGRLARRGVTLSAGLCAPMLTEGVGLSTPALAATLKAALAFGEGAETSGTAVALAEGVLQGMVVAKSKLAAGMVLTFGLLACVGLNIHRAAAVPEPVAAAVVAAEAKPAPQPPPVDQFGDPLPPDALARLGTIRLRHGATVRGLAFAPDGQTLASAGIDGNVHIWEASTGKELRRIVNERFPGLGLGAVNCLDFAPDGKTLAGTRINQPACIWDVATGNKVREFGGERHRAAWIVFSPDGKTVAYGGDQQEDQASVRLAEVETGKDVARFDGHTGYVKPAVFSPDGKRLATADDRGIHLFDLAGGRKMEWPQANKHTGSVCGLAFSPDGKTLATATGENKVIELVEAATGKTVHTIRLTGAREAVYRVLFTRDGSTLISGHEDGFIRFWDPTTGMRTRQFRAHGNSHGLILVALSPDGLTLATSSNSHVLGDQTIRLWETATGKPLVRHAGPQEAIARVVFSPDSKYVATASWEDAVHLWDAASGKLLREWKHFGPLAFLPDGRSLICAGWTDGKVRVLDLNTGAESRQFLAHKKGVHDLALSRDGKLLATDYGYESLRLWDLASGRAIQDFGGWRESHVLRVALSPDTKLLGSVHQDHTVRLWDTSTGKLLREYAETDNIGSIAFSPDGKLFASSYMGDRGRNRLIRLREVATGKEVHQLRGHADATDHLAFSPDGRTLIWGGQHYKDLNCWEVATGQLRRTFAGHQGELTCLAFSPSGRLMASGSRDASVLIWDVAGQRRRREAPAAALGAEQLDQLWSDLTASDATAAYRAMCTLRESPGQAVPLLERHLQPVPRVDAQRLSELLRELDSDQLKVRDRAAWELERLDTAAEPALRRALADRQPTLEQRRRLERLLERLEGIEAWRQSRALEIVEWIGDTAARRLLTRLAQGAPDARLTREAHSALARLEP
jgi:RNA polymerase sigma factor (sigma-70 family)